MAGRYLQTGQRFRYKVIITLLASLFAWVLLSLLFFWAAYIFKFGLSLQNLESAGDIWGNFLRNPFYLFSLYKAWGGMLLSEACPLSPLCLLPAVPLLMLLIFWAVMYKRSDFAFHLWYRLHKRLAQHEDIEAMGLLKGRLMNLGKHEDETIRLSQPYSVFCLGAPGSGKTSGVAIPSILESDGYSIAAVDNNGGLARYTSGYRAEKGPVFYFNWELEDNPRQGEFWPRWNPLSFDNMPPAGKRRDEYLLFMARYLIPLPENSREDNYWVRLSVLALEGLLHFFVSKIEQAQANDYFLGLFLEKSKLGAEDREILLSYYADMPEEYSRPAIKNLQENKLDHDNYLPVGSWEGIPEAWQGKELCPAMFADFLLRRYFEVSAAAGAADIGGWKLVAESFLAEAELFAYHQKARAVLRQISYLSRKQRGIIFPMLLQPLSMFRSGSLRERTASSDFRLRDMRGMKNGEGVTEPVTLYNVAGTRAAKFISRFLIDVMLNEQLKEEKKPEDLPVLYVFDDLSEMPSCKNLREALTHGWTKDISFLLLGTDVGRLQKIYGTEGLEEIISNTAYKLMIGDNNRQLSQNFVRLAEFATKSVQIPLSDIGSFSRAKGGLSDAGYYLKLAKDLQSPSKRDNIKKGSHLLLAEGYYHLPMQLKTDYFYRNEALQRKALNDAAYLLDDKFLRRRNPQDKEVPGVLKALEGAGIRLEREEDIDRYLHDYYEEAVENMQELPDAEAVLADDISARWKKNDTAGSGKEAMQNDEWWLSEEGFSLREPNDKNPFDKNGQNS